MKPIEEYEQKIKGITQEVLSSQKRIELLEKEYKDIINDISFRDNLLDNSLNKDKIALENIKMHISMLKNDIADFKDETIALIKKFKEIARKDEEQEVREKIDKMNFEMILSKREASRVIEDMLESKDKI